MTQVQPVPDTLSLPCPQCNHKLRESLARLRLNREVSCTHCGNAFTVTEAQLEAFLRMREQLGR